MLVTKICYEPDELGLEFTDRSVAAVEVRQWTVAVFTSLVSNVYLPQEFCGENQNKKVEINKFYTKKSHITIQGINLELLAVKCSVCARLFSSTNSVL